VGLNCCARFEPWRIIEGGLSYKSPPRKGLTTEAGVLCSVRGKKLPPEQAHHC
jgi:hypothetical protein